MSRKLRMGMVGGGPGAFIGGVHRKAAAIDGKIELVAGAFDIDPAKSMAMGRELCLDSSRVYSDFREMIAKETALPAERRIDFVAVTTPNNWHFPIAKAFLEAGFNVMCEKPMTMTLAEAEELEQVVKRSGKVFGLMHNYPAYPMVKLARDMVKSGRLGEIRKVVVQYAQGWLARAIEKQGQMQASWRTDPKQSGAGGCVGDIGTHAENLAEYVTGLRITDICAETTSFIPGRPLDDDVNVLLKFNNGAKGILHASQISIGEENGLRIWVYGSDAAIEWYQEQPNHLTFKPLDKPVEIWSRGNGYVGEISPAAARGTRVPAGHPEGFLEAFANNYSNFADTILSKAAGKEPDALMNDFPQVADGVRGMAFIEAVVKSAKSDRKWTKFE
ncbi:MAG TPA: Gfo/Idh/MocA family oxidoreductase [Phycisphaerae bacterium]|nr:Gfo/Idh/MocA family oxidoreductase [Phycisphaerae bacterium]HPS53015.1 Gfo/Idh/MocA family oxidoreductase [Phycisphaerae bacterium]